jgi:hypothetical protein
MSDNKTMRDDKTMSDDKQILRSRAFRAMSDDKIDER